ncbi:hypothetical protein [Minwuia sp.]|uniref:hypothetical protein n=1 Tax=Minwuia sp. TaxID=2493630 RepID=UPI003A9139EC
MISTLGKRGGKIIICIVFAGTVGLAIYFIYWSFYTYPFFDYTAACKNYERDPDLYPRYGRLKTINGIYTLEFRFHVLKYYRDIIPADWPGIEIVENEIHMTGATYFNYLYGGGKYDDELEGYRYNATQAATQAIMQTRISEGRFGPEIQKQFMVQDWSVEGDQRMMHPDECGLAEELILAGGALTGDPPHAPGQ